MQRESKLDTGKPYASFSWMMLLFVQHFLSSLKHNLVTQYIVFVWISETAISAKFLLSGRENSWV